jgi:hypothetical protein
MRLRLAAAIAAVPLLAAACGGSGTTTTTTAPTTTAPPERMTVKAYFLRDGKVTPAHVRVERTEAVARAALTGLFDGPPPGFETAVPAAVGDFDVSIADGTARLTLPSSPELSVAARAQIVYTLTQFPTVRRVRLGDAEATTRADYEDETPIILVETPVAGDAVTSPVHVAGTANTFEANLQLRIVQNGRKLYEHFVTATSGSGQRGTFAWDIPLETTGPAMLEAFEYSAADGSETHKVVIPIRLK